MSEGVAAESASFMLNFLPSANSHGQQTPGQSLRLGQLPLNPLDRSEGSFSFSPWFCIYHINEERGWPK